MRIYDPGVGRFLSVDPLQKQYPELTPYQFASNTPIETLDLDGLERSSAGKIGIFAIDNTALVRYSNQIPILKQPEANAPKTDDKGKKLAVVLPIKDFGYQVSAIRRKGIAY